VIEVNQPDKATRRRQGKTDTLDAQGRRPSSPPAAGPVAARRPVTGRWRCCGVFKLAKSSAITARTQTINQPESRARRG
jgi:hypothetical protein